MTDIVFESTKLFTDQCEQAWKESSALIFGNGYQNIYNIVVCGMGGSRFPAKTVKELFRDRIREPYEIIDDYTLPSYVDSDTLVILSSYSGNTEEVIFCANDAIQRKARISTITSGGLLAEFLKKNNSVGYVFQPKFNPSGQPRIGVGYMLMGHIGLLRALNLLDISDREVNESIQFAKKLEIQGKSEKLASTLKNTHPIIVTSEFLKGFGNGFANQLNETAKMISDYRHIPELNHHLMEGLQNPQTLKQRGLFLFVFSPLYSNAIQKRYRITKDIVEKQHMKTCTIELNGSSKLAQVLEAYSLSGLVTFYLAQLYNVDPSKIPWVDYFKHELAKYEK